MGQQLSNWGERILELARPGSKPALEDAYVYLREHEAMMDQHEARMLKQGLIWKLTGGDRRSVKMILGLGLFALLSGGVFNNRVQDMFAFLGKTFRPYMYIAVAVPLLINLILSIVQLRRGVKMLRIDKLIGLRRNGQAYCVTALAAVLLGLSLLKLVPLAQDLPAVLQKKYAIGVVTEERVDEWAIYNALMYRGIQEPLENPPIPWCQNPPRSALTAAIFSDPYNRSIFEINVNDTTMRMSGLQFHVMDIPDYDSLPFVIEYLPHSRLVLWISGIGGDRS